MTYRKIAAIIRRERLADVERRLIELCVGGITVTPVKGFGEYANYFRGDLLVPHVRLEIFTTAARADEIVQAILDEACTERAGDGIVAVQAVERVVRVRTKAPATADSL